MTTSTAGATAGVLPPLPRATQEAAVYARRLLPLAAASLAGVPAHARPPLLQALEAFLDAPGPSSYMAAWRVLKGAHVRLEAHRLRMKLDAHALPDALAELAAVPGMPPRVVQQLAALVPDGSAAPRIRALAALWASRGALAGKVEAAAERRRRQMEELRRSQKKKPRARR